MFLFIQAIGDNGQGFANFLLYCLFTKNVRDKMCCKRHLVDVQDSEEIAPLQHSYAGNASALKKRYDGGHLTEKGTQSTSMINRESSCLSQSGTSIPDH